MSLVEREFSMEYPIKNASKLSDGEIQWSDETVWHNLICKLDGFLGVSVYCSQTSNTWIKNCQVSAIFKCEIVSDSGETHKKCRFFNMKRPRKMEGPIIDFEKFLKWDEMEKNFLTADSAKIVVFVDDFTTSEDRSVLRGNFGIPHTFKNLARFEENETQFSDAKECAGTSWRICIKKEEGYFGCYLQYEGSHQKFATSKIWHVKLLCNLRIKTKDNYERFNLGKLEFSKHTMQGNNKLMKWEKLVSNHLVNDSVTVEADLNVLNLAGYKIFDKCTTKKFVLSQQFSDVSRIEDGESRFSRFVKRFNIPWRIELKRVSGFLEIHLHRGVEIEKADDAFTIIKADCWFKLVSTNGNWISYMKPVFYERCFFITCLVNNVSKFQDGEKQWGNTELRYDIPWRIQARRTLDFLELYIFCDEDDHGSKKLIQTKCTFNLVSTNGNNYRRTSKLCFEKSGGQGISKFIKWNDMIESFLNPLEDSLIVEAHVKIYMVEEFSRKIPQNERTFLMSHTVRNVSNAEEETVVFSATEKCYDVQWSTSMKYINGFVELLLSCDKEFNAYEAWSVEARVQLILVGANGKRLTDYFEHTFEKPDSIGDSKLIRWEDMLEKYVVNGNVTVEARVNFVEHVNIDN